MKEYAAGMGYEIYRVKIDEHDFQNGFTFVCALNELEVVQSSCLLNIRLEANNSTLVWSKPAWDISNAWISPAISSSPNSKLNAFIIVIFKWVIVFLDITPFY